MKWVNQRILLPLLVLLFFIPAFFVRAQSQYPKTIDALQERYTFEIEAVQEFLAYAQKALSEDYPNIAYLFIALATSESVHARNFKRLLCDLGFEVKEIAKPEFEVSSTRRSYRVRGYFSECLPKKSKRLMSGFSCARDVAQH
jgi:hypothetical protein